MPGSHKPEAVAAIQSYREEQGVDWESMEDDEQRNFTDAYTAIGLQPGILNAKAGDLIFFDTALYHGVCHAEDPVANGPTPVMEIWSLILYSFEIELCAPRTDTYSAGRLPSYGRHF